MSQEEKGVVLEVNNGVTNVRVNRKCECGDSCTTSLVLDVINPIGAKPGQFVTIDVIGGNTLIAALMIFILPLIIMFIGSMLGEWIAFKGRKSLRFLEVSGGILGFMLSIISIKLYDNYIRNDSKMKPTIIRILY
jgi:sigma-E factor negative regulatory protein RseC